MPLEVTFPTVSVVANDDIGAARQGTGGHTLYGAAIPISDTHYWWVTVDDVGADPDLAGMTGVEVQLSGAGPFTGTAVATAAETAASGLGYTLSRTNEVVEVSGGTLDETAAQTVIDGLVDFSSRGGGTLIGSLDNANGANIGSNSTGWIQVDPADVPSGAFRVIGFELYRGNDVTDGVRMYVADGGAGDGDPEGCVIRHQRTMGNSGANNLHREWLAHDEVVEYSGGERLFIGFHGNNATSSIIGGANVNAGLWEDGIGNNLWLTDGTTGDTTPAVSPAGPVTSSFNFGVIGRLIIQEAPYQDDGAYRVIVGAVPGVHDQDLNASGTETEDIFVGWGFFAPDIDGIQHVDTEVNFRNHASGASNQKRLELWTADGGELTFVGDTLIGEIGTTTDTQGTGWTSVHQSGDVSLTPGAAYRFSIKGVPSTGVLFEVDVGGAGVDARAPAYALNLTSPLAYPITDTFEAGELEVLAPSQGGDETTIDFDPQTATASPNNADGTIVFPGNIGMIALYLGPPGPSYVVTNPGETGTGTVVDDDDVVSGSGVAANIGTGSATDDDDTVGGSGAASAVGTGTVQDDDDTVVGSGGSGLTGSGSATDDDDVVAGSGVAANVGTGTVGDSDDVVTGSGTAAQSSGTTGTGTVADADDVVAAVGTVPSPTGVGTVTDDDDVVSGGNLDSLPTSPIVATHTYTATRAIHG